MADGGFLGGGGEMQNHPTPGKHRGPRFSWNSAYEQTFFHSLCESVQAGLREGMVFKQEAWERAIQALRDKHGATPNKGHLINKSDNARKKFRLWRSLVENPEFSYDADRKMVFGTDEAWKRHTDREQLARTLRDKAFEHEEYYQILFPDVVGSGGAPKRVTKSRRKTDNTGSILPDDQDGQQAALMDTLFTESVFDPPSLTQHRPLASNALPVATTTIPMPVPAPVQPRPTSTQVPTRSSIATSSALTPPEEQAPHKARKRFLAPGDVVSSNGHQQLTSPPKRQRQSAAAPAPARVDQTPETPSSALPSSATAPTPVAPATSAVIPAPSTGPAPAAGPVGVSGPNPDSVAALADAIASRLSRQQQQQRSGWPEQALDIFFREFGNEDMDLQLRVAEKVLTDDNKALAFCKMPEALRKHYVKKLRELFSRLS